jgi:mannose-6-phosphate isomerase-like protein (cupin superfamily)
MYLAQMQADGKAAKLAADVERCVLCVLSVAVGTRACVCLQQAHSLQPCRMLTGRGLRCCRRPPRPPKTRRFVFVVDGEAQVDQGSSSSQLTLKANDYAYFPPGSAKT